MKTLYLICGPPGTGKTTLAQMLAQYVDVILAADDYFTDAVTGEYKFDGSKLREAHADCQSRTEYHMKHGRNVIVHNYFTLRKHRDPYYELASKYGYFVQEIHLINFWPQGNQHGVPNGHC